MTFQEVEAIFGKPDSINDSLMINWLYNYNSARDHEVSNMRVKRMLSINFDDGKVVNYLYSSSLQHFYQGRYRTDLTSRSLHVFCNDKRITRKKSGARGCPASNLLN